MVKLLWATVIAVAFAFPAAAACRLALILAVDVSGSVDPREYRLQLDGIAAALLDPDVSAQILATPETPVHLYVFEWSDITYQKTVVDWLALDSYARLQQAAGLLNTRSAHRGGRGSTAIGGALWRASKILSDGPKCWAKTIDVSGDGTNNHGPEPERYGTQKFFPNTTINGLVIGSDASRGRDERQMEIMELSAYFRKKVIRGPGAFIEIAQGFDDFERAMTRKLLRETEVPAIGLRPLTKQPRYADLR